MKYCQGPICHTYKTKDRLRGPKGDKHYQTRRRSQLMYHSFCSQCCVDDWFACIDDTLLVANYSQL